MLSQLPRSHHDDSFEKELSIVNKAATNSDSVFSFSWVFACFLKYFVLTQFLIVLYIFHPPFPTALCRTDDAEVIFNDAEMLGLMVEDFAWIVAERAFAATNTPVGELCPPPPPTHPFSVVLVTVLISSWRWTGMPWSVFDEGLLWL